VNKHRLAAFARFLPALLLALAGVLGSCSITRPVRRTEPGGPAPQMLKPGGLLEAAARGDLARVRDLLKADPALLEATDGAGWDALHYAAWNAHPQVHEYLLQQGAEGDLFTEAALGPWQSFLQRVETNPIGVDSRDAQQKATPLIWAVRTGNQAGCEVLLARGADLRARDRGGNGALHHAILMDRVELIEFLLSAGADADGENMRGQTPLHLAASAGSFEACRLLLDRGACLDQPDEEGNTPLHVAAEAGAFELCEYFLFLGASPSLQNAQGRTARDMAAERGHGRVVQLLEARTP
jgi:ankyrin repeat protein